MDLSGKSLIGGREGAESGEAFQAWNPATGGNIAPPFYSATGEETDRAVNLAAEAFPALSRLRASDRAAFLRSIAAKLDAAAEALVERANLETALSKPRLQGEVGRTTGQLRLFAKVIEEGSWVMARIDHGEPQRKPLAKPDVRSMWHALGPVVVFGASNFPLAFSVAGGDTASALAAGNPVIVKAHAAHPGTSELVGRTIRESVREQGLPEGVFSLLFDSGTRVGVALVKHPLVKAGGFTGSIPAGRALMDISAARPEPIPFYAEMGSTNPVFLLPGAVATRGQEIAAKLHASFTIGSGQFCTKPGMIFLAKPDGAGVGHFMEEFRGKSSASPKFTMLTAGIRAAYQREIESRKGRDGVTLVAEGEQPAGEAAFFTGATVFETEATELASDENLSSEVFGPTTLLVKANSKEEILTAARNLGGHLTATIHGTPEDLREFAELIEILRTKAGRMVFNGYPTGVEVCDAMIHGGPYPASSQSSTTSVGTMAIYRFARPVCYQDFPDEALPEELREQNSRAIWRMVDGEMKK